MSNMNLEIIKYKIQEVSLKVFCNNDYCSTLNLWKDNLQ